MFNTNQDPDARIKASKLIERWREGKIPPAKSAFLADTAVLASTLFLLAQGMEREFAIVLWVWVALNSFVILCMWCALWYLERNPAMGVSEMFLAEMPWSTRVLSLLSDACLFAAMAFFGQLWAVGALVPIYVVGYVAVAMLRSRTRWIARNWK